MAKNLPRADGVFDVVLTNGAGELVESLSSRESVVFVKDGCETIAWWRRTDVKNKKTFTIVPEQTTIRIDTDAGRLELQNPPSLGGDRLVLQHHGDARGSAGQVMSRLAAAISEFVKPPSAAASAADPIVEDEFEFNEHDQPRTLPMNWVPEKKKQQAQQPRRTQQPSPSRSQGSPRKKPGLAQTQAARQRQSGRLDVQKVPLVSTERKYPPSIHFSAADVERDAEKKTKKTVVAAATTSSLSPSAVLLASAGHKLSSRPSQPPTRPLQPPQPPPAPKQPVQAPAIALKRERAPEEDEDTPWQSKKKPEEKVPQKQESLDQIFDDFDIDRGIDDPDFYPHVPRTADKLPTTTAQRTVQQDIRTYAGYGPRSTNVYTSHFFSRYSSSQKHDGFRNLGNTCYLNAVLQALLSLPTFVQDLVQPKLVEILDSGKDSQASATSASDDSPSFSLRAPTASLPKRRIVVPDETLDLPDDKPVLPASKPDANAADEDEKPPELGEPAATPDGIVAATKTEDATTEVAAAAPVEPAEAAAPRPPQRIIGLSFYRSLVEISEERKREHGVLDPTKVKEALARHLPQFKGFSQQDAHEFLVLGLGHLEEALEQAIGKQCSESTVPLCPVLRNFRSSVECKISCTRCGDSSTGIEFYNVLSLDILRYNSQLSDLLRHFFSSTKLERKCEKCGCQDATCERRMVALPRILVLHLKRFRITASGSYTKSSTIVQSTLNLDIASVLAEDAKMPAAFEDDSVASVQQQQQSMSDDDEQLRRALEASKREAEEMDSDLEKARLESIRGMYKLRSAVWHSGSTATSGHYVACVFDEKSSKWTRFNDSFSEALSQLSFSTQDQSQGYLYFFQHASLTST